MAKGHYKPFLNRRAQRLSTATKGGTVAQVGKNMKIMQISLY